MTLSIGPLRRLAPAALVALTLALGCAPRHPGAGLAVREVAPDFLATLAATDPALAADAHGRVALTYITRDGFGANLWVALSRDSGDTFEQPSRVNVIPGAVLSYPEGRPLAAFGPSGELAIGWAEKRPGSPAVDVVVRASGDGGASFGAPTVVNDDAPSARPLPGAPSDSVRARPPGVARNPAAFHGLPALAILEDGALFAAWLDQRENPPGPGEPSTSALYAATSLDGGQNWSVNAKVADSACACCRPFALGAAGDRLAIAYRAGAGDLRDPALAVSFDGGRSFALDTIVSADGWRLAGCPVQGPALVWNRVRGGTYAWSTGADPPGVYIVPWRYDLGSAGLKRLVSDSLVDAQHPRLAALGGATLIAVEARAPDDSARTVLAVRALAEDGNLSRWTVLGADTHSATIVGLGPHDALAAWVEDRTGGARVRIVRLRLD